MKHTLQKFSVDYFRRLLSLKNMNQNDLSEYLGMSRQSVSGYLTGKTDFSLDMFEKFCEVLEVSCKQVIENFDDPLFINEPANDYKTNAALLRAENRHLTNELESYKKIEAVLNRQIDSLYKQVSTLEFQLTKANETIESLTKNK